MNEERFTALEKKVSTIMENHLPHLQISINSLDLKVGIIMWISSIVGTSVILFIINSFLNLIKK